MADYQAVLLQIQASGGPVDYQGQSPHVIGWVSYESVPVDVVKRLGGWGGFIEPGDRWKEFAEACDNEDMPYYEALRRDVLRRKLKHGGDWHQSDPKGVPLFCDGAVAMFSFRGWGDLMAAIWAEHENREYSYMDFYMESCLPMDDDS